MHSPAPPPSPLVLHTAGEIRALVREAQQRGERVGVVPTMGALHQGHLSLVEQARRECDRVVTTIFVNPTQFAPGEDFDTYPRDVERDTDLLAQHRCDWVFAPSREEMYPAGAETSIDVGSVAVPLEGVRRPTHFAGVATIVLKLFQVIPADVAYFGEKDYQQTLVIRQLVRDLLVPIEIRVEPTVRDSDGLALSSRNAYLSAAHRAQAPALHRGMQLARQQLEQGETSAATLRETILQFLTSQGPFEVDYIALVEEGTVNQVDTITGPTRVLVAARLGTTRLIDNMALS